MNPAPAQTERKYALTRIGAGDYLLPSNDGERLWRIYSYREDGSAEWAGGAKIIGTFWACARHVRPLPSLPRDLPDDFFDWSDDWEGWSHVLPTRKAAIEEAMRA